MFALTSRLTRGAMACVCAAVLAGCAGGDGASDLTTQSVAQTPAAVPAGKGRIVLSRPGGILYAASAATVKVNGSKVADLYGGNSQTVNVICAKP